uniref:PAXX non-homologous end joining factor n=1 Tax=Salvator merianae TaxID=96440 RepID=A0A8D0BY88_SALMN
MAPPPLGPFRIAHHQGQRFLCFWRNGESNVPRLHVTNGSELWSGDVASDKLDKLLAQDGRATWEDRLSNLREDFGNQTPALSVHESEISLQFQGGGQTLTFDLHKTSIAETRQELQDILFGLVEKVQELEKGLKEMTVAAPSTVRSPEIKPSQSRCLFVPELSPIKRRNGGGAGQGAIKRRIPGESLINPGFLSKKMPTGVDFEDL